MISRANHTHTHTQTTREKQQSNRNASNLVCTRIIDIHQSVPAHILRKDEKHGIEDTATFRPRKRKKSNLLPPKQGYTCLVIYFVEHE